MSRAQARSPGVERLSISSFVHAGATVALGLIPDGPSSETYNVRLVTKLVGRVPHSRTRPFSKSAEAQ